ncbi:type VII secretion target [Mycobacterium sp. pW045]|uniref:type VII secretion target n=1 Tax=Mycobacterium sp. pW045 TaxID=3238984 RepID=UPI00351B96CD
MTSPASLQVTPASLRELAQRCEALAAQVAPMPPAVTASSWQDSAAAVSTTNAGGSRAATAMRGRMTATSNKLTTAAHDYEAMDNDGAAALAAVTRRPAGLTPLAPRGSGIDDGAAAGFGIPR